MADKHRVLVVGVGSIGERHVRCLLGTGRATVGICEPNAALREKIRDRYDVAGAYDSLDAALSESWDSVILASPANTHLPLARQTVERGLPTLIEKPLAVLPDGADELSALIAERGVTVGVAYVYRAHTALAAMREAIASGRFGQPLQVGVLAGQHFPFHRPAYAKTYYTSHESGGGAIQDALTHILNASEWLVGPITRLAALADHRVLPEVEVEDTVNMLARHGDVFASYSFNQHQAPNEVSIQVVCSKGTCRFQVHRHLWQWATEPDQPWQDEPAVFAERDDWFTAQKHAWLDALEGRAKPLCTFDEALQTLRVNRAALDSAGRDGAWVDI